MVWYTKKYLDYCDWKALFHICNKGFHYLPEGNALVDRILSQMNNNRLSNSPNGEEGGSLVNRDQLQTDISELLSRSSNYEVRDGKTYIKSLNRLKGSPTSKGVELRDFICGDIIESFASIWLR